MILVPSGYGLANRAGPPALPQAHINSSPFCFGRPTVCATYRGSVGLQGRVRDRPGKARPQGACRNKETKMSIEQFIASEVKSNDVVLFMKGTPQFPQCGFSGQVVQILDHIGVDYKGLNVLECRRSAQRHQGLLELADHSAALRQGRVRRRLRHRPRDVPGRRIAAAVCRQGHRGRRRGLIFDRAPDWLGAAGSHHC